MATKVSEKVRAKLRDKHGVAVDEVEQCFAMRDRTAIFDEREQNDAVGGWTMWFIAETYWGRKLKVVFVLRNDGDTEVKTAYPPSEEEIRLFEKRSKPRDDF